MEEVLDRIYELAREDDELLSLTKKFPEKQIAEMMDTLYRLLMSRPDPMEWLEKCAPWLSHVHLHNNDGSWDTHSPLDEGTIPVKELLIRLDALCPKATITLELMDAEASLQWLKEELEWI